MLSGERVAIWNLAGRTELVAGSGSEVIVELTRGGDDGSRLAVEANAGRMVVKYPSRDIVYRERTDSRGWEARLRVDDDGTFTGGWDDDRSGRSVRIRSSGGGLEAHADLRIQVPPGQRVAIYVGVGEIEATNVNGEIELRTNASSIRGHGLQGRFTGRTGSGRIFLDNVNTERTTASTGSGSIELNSVTSGELRVSTGSGSIQGRSIKADRLDASTGSGSVRLDLQATPTDLSARTGSGGVTLRLPANTDADLDIRTGSGGISTDFPVTMEQVRRNALRGRIGAGTGGRFRVSTGSGGVRLERQ